MAEYWIGLRLSASVATTFFPFELRRAPEPIIRLNQVVKVSGFDLRELVFIGEECGVVTLPSDIVPPAIPQAFSPN